MKNLNIAVGKALVSFKIKETIIILTVSTILPFLVHLLPAYNDAPVGARLLPLFYAPFIAVIFFRLHVGVIAAMLAPLFNALLTGLPDLVKVFILTNELILFTLASYFLFLRWRNFWLIAPFAYLSAKIASLILMKIIPSLSLGQSPAHFFLTSVKNAIPGIFILTLINIAAITLKNKNANA